MIISTALKYLASVPAGNISLLNLMSNSEQDVLNDFHHGFTSSSIEEIAGLLSFWHIIIIIRFII